MGSALRGDPGTWGGPGTRDASWRLLFAPGADGLGETQRSAREGAAPPEPPGTGVHPPWPTAFREVSSSPAPGPAGGRRPSLGSTPASLPCPRALPTLTLRSIEARTQGPPGPAGSSDHREGGRWGLQVRLAAKSLKTHHPGKALGQPARHHAGGGRDRPRGIPRRGMAGGACPAQQVPATSPGARQGLAGLFDVGIPSVSDESLMHLGSRSRLTAGPRPLLPPSRPAQPWAETTPTLASSRGCGVGLVLRGAPAALCGEEGVIDGQWLWPREAFWGSWSPCAQIKPRMPSST